MMFKKKIVQQNSSDKKISSAQDPKVNISNASPVQKKIRPAYVSGAFYPENPILLERQVDEFIKNAPSRVPPFFARPYICIVPHAGYMFSGQIAADVFFSTMPFLGDIITILLIGPSHRNYFDGFATVDYDELLTPIGSVEVDKKEVDRLVKNHKNLFIDCFVHRDEHSLEVQLPFIKKLFPLAKVVPILTSNSNSNELAKIIEDFITPPNGLVVISSDLSHYLPYEDGKKTDEKTIFAIENLIPSSITDTKACGFTGVLASIEAAKTMGLVCRSVSSCSSGDTDSSKDSVVGYASFGFIKARDQEFDISMIRQEGGVLLDLAKKSVAYALKNQGRRLVVKNEDHDPLLTVRRGAFVTIEKMGELRGCVGVLRPHASLVECVVESAYDAAFGDKRFEPINNGELDELDFSVSVLTKPVELIYTSYDDLLTKISINVDGLVISHNGKTGLFLPSVWSSVSSKEEFLAHLLKKAGIPDDFWPNDAKIEVFQALYLK